MKVIQQKDKTYICLGGELTIHNVAVLRDGLLQVLGRNDRFEIDLEGVTALDLAGLQLLCSVHRSALAQGKTLSLNKRLVPVLLQAREVAGFVLNQSCRDNPAADCFWVGGMQE